MSDNPDTYDQSETVMEIGRTLTASVSGLSFLGSLFVIITAILFTNIFRRKIFMQIVLAVSVSDLIGNLALLGGNMPSSETVFCPMQGAFIYYFYRASWFYTVSLSYQLYSLVYNGKTTMKITTIHVVVHAINLTLEFIPLISTEYGNDDLASGKLPCSIKGGSENSFAGGLHDAVTFNVPILVSFLIMLYFYLRIRWKFYTQSDGLKSYPAIASAVNLVGLYPFSMMICWIPLILLIFFINTFHVTKWLLLSYYWIFSSGCLYGFVLSIIFICKSKEARQRWYALIESILRLNKDRNPPSNFDGKIGDFPKGNPDGKGELVIISQERDMLEEDDSEGYLNINEAQKASKAESSAAEWNTYHKQSGTSGVYSEESVEIRTLSSDSNYNNSRILSTDSNDCNSPMHYDL